MILDAYRLLACLTNNLSGYALCATADMLKKPSSRAPFALRVPNTWNDTAQRLASDECMIDEGSESLKMTISYRKTPQGVVQDL